MRPKGGKYIVVEGISGVGKTYWIEQIIAQNPNIVHVEELGGTNLGKKIIEVLSSTDDRFFRLGYPLTEAMLLTGRKLYDVESQVLPNLRADRVVLQDRCIDTVALYSAVLLNYKYPELKILNTYQTLLNNYASLAFLPDKVIYLKDNFEACIARANKRELRPYDQSELKLLSDVHMWFDKIISLDLDRFKVVDLNKIRVAGDVIKAFEEVCFG